MGLCSMAGCATKPPPAVAPAYAADGAVRADIVDVASAQRYQAVPGTSYLRPVPRRANAAPAYPPALLARRLPPVAVVARIVVDGSGRVAHASLLDDGGGEPAFADAVLVAVRDWTFVPLLRVSGSTAEPLPFTQDYRFTFSQVNGRAVVASTGAR